MRRECHNHWTSENIDFFRCTHRNVCRPIAGGIGSGGPRLPMRCGERRSIPTRPVAHALGTASRRRDSWCVAAQPTGTVTLLFSDIEGSTRLLEQIGAERYRETLELHRDVLRASFERHEGYEVDTEGDSFFVTFSSAAAAVAAAVDGQRGLSDTDWPGGHAIRVRIGIHTGHPLAVPSNYVGM
jgi:class 3 adenylate cyclase